MIHNPLKKRLKDSIALLYVFSSVLFANTLADKVIVKKSTKTLFLMKKGKILKQYHVVFGAHPKVHKRQEGDERTPEGNYTLDYKNRHSKFYKSIHISYPNRKDREKARQRGVNPGGGIFIHGQKNGWEWLSSISPYFNWTDGCIAVENKEMDEIWESVKPGTPIEIKP